MTNTAPEVGGDAYEVAAWLRREGAWGLLADFTRSNPEVGPLPLPPRELEPDELPEEPARQRPAPGPAVGECPLHGQQAAVWFTVDGAETWGARCGRSMPKARVCFRELADPHAP